MARVPKIVEMPEETKTLIESAGYTLLYDGYFYAIYLLVDPDGQWKYLTIQRRGKESMPLLLTVRSAAFNGYSYLFSGERFKRTPANYLSSQKKKLSDADFRQRVDDIVGFVRRAQRANHLLPFLDASMLKGHMEADGVISHE